VHRRRSGAVGEAHDLVDPVAPPDDQRAAESSERGVEIGEGVGEKTEAVRGPA